MYHGGQQSETATSLNPHIDPNFASTPNHLLPHPPCPTQSVLVLGQACVLRLVNRLAHHQERECACQELACAPQEQEPTLRV